MEIWLEKKDKISEFENGIHKLISRKTNYQKLIKFSSLLLLVSL